MRDLGRELDGYDAFISYNHAGDRPLALAIQTGLQQFAKPWYRRRALRVFRDESSLSATPGLWPTITGALVASNYFLLIASPESSRSHWVGQEVEYWLSLGRRDRLLIVLSSGKLVWADRDFDWAHTDALPPILRQVFDEEPLYVDLRWARGQHVVSRRDARLTEPLASLAAPIHGVPRDALIGDDLRQHRRTLRFARAAVTSLVVLLVAAILASVVAVGQRNRAEDQARIATARLLANEATSVGPDALDVGYLLAAQAYAAAPNLPSSWGALVGALTRAPFLVGYLPGSASATSTVAAPSGDILAVGAEDGNVALWRAQTRERLQVLPQSGQGRSSLAQSTTALAFSDDGGRLIAGNEAGHYTIWKVATGELVDSGNVPGMIVAVGLDADGGRFAVGTDEALLVGRTQRAPLQISGPEYSTKLVFGPDTLIAADQQGRVVTWRLSTRGRISDNLVSLGQPLASAFTRDLRLFAGVTLGNDPYIVDTRSGRSTPVKVGQTGLSVEALSFDPAGSTLTMATRTGVIQWDVAAKRLKAPVLAGIPGPTVRDAIAVENGGDLIAAVGDRGVAVWNLNAAPILVRQIKPRGISPLDDVPSAMRGATSAVFSSDGALLAWTALEAARLVVIVWDLDSARERARLPGEQVVSFSPDGKSLATQAFNDSSGAVQVTDLDSGRTGTYAAIPWGGRASPSPSTDGGSDKPWVVESSRGLGASIPADGNIGLWDASRHQQIASISLNVQPDAGALAFDPEGNRLAVAVSGGFAYTIDVNPNSWRTQACLLAARHFTEAERATYLEGVSLVDACP